MNQEESAQPSSKLFQIGEVADQVGLSLRTVRYYEEVELLAPTARSEGGFRLYDQSQVERLKLIKRMKPLGMSLDEMRLLLDARDSLATSDSKKDRSDAGARLEQFVGLAEERCEDLEEKLLSAREFAGQLREELRQGQSQSR